MNLRNLRLKLRLHGLNLIFQQIHGVGASLTRGNGAAVLFCGVVAHLVHERDCHIVELPLNRPDLLLTFGGDCGHYASTNEQRKNRHNNRSSGKTSQLLVIPFRTKVHCNNSSYLAL